jgi:hypothetical protein
MALGERMQPLLLMNIFSLKAQPSFLACAEASPKIWHETCPADGAIWILAMAKR